MAVRDEKYNWKKESIKFDSEIKEKLTPILEKMLEMGFTEEDFVYIVTFSLSDISINHAFKMTGR